METKIYNTGVIEDPRSKEEKEKDYQAIEVATFSPIKWEQKKKEDWTKFPIRDQDGSGTCVAQTGAKLLGIENENEEDKFIEFSARDIYERRGNKPYEGMWGPDALNIISKFGATTEKRLPSQKMSEAEINKAFTRAQEDLDIAQKYRAGGYVELPAGDIDKIADVILNKKKGVMLFIYAKGHDEWTDIPTVIYKNLPRGEAKINHSITAVDAFMYGGEKCLLIEDSWGKFIGLKGQRIITESFLKARNYFAGYILDLSNNWKEEQKPKKPKYTFSSMLKYGSMKNADVKALQDILKYEELFPTQVESTGNYLQITAKAVFNWQVKHNVASMAELNELAGKQVGPKTIKKLNELYS